MKKIGSKVYAVLSADDDVVRAFGTGIYVGDEVPPFDGPDAPVGFIADMVREIGHANPKIVLDGGGVVWGCECWWGATTEERFARGRRVEKVDLVTVRRQAREEVEA